MRCRRAGRPSLEVGYWMADPRVRGHWGSSKRSRPSAMRPARSPPSTTTASRSPSYSTNRPCSTIGDLSALSVIRPTGCINAELQAQVQAQVLELEASRRRLVDVADEERRELEHRLQEGAIRDCTCRGPLRGWQASQNGPSDGPSDATDGRRRVRRPVGDAQRARELANGLRPALLSEHGLPAALAELVARSAVPVTFPWSREVVARCGGDRLLRLRGGPDQCREARPRHGCVDPRYTRRPMASRRGR